MRRNLLVFGFVAVVLCEPVSSAGAEPLDGTVVAEEVLAFALSADPFWAVRAEAARFLGSVRAPETGELLESALAAENARVRKGGARGLRAIGPSATARLRQVVESDPDASVAATAQVALAHLDPALDRGLLERQANRQSWYDVLRRGALIAAKEIGRADLVPFCRASAGPAFHQDVRQAALEAWEKAAPADPALHAELLSLADGPILKLQLYALEALDELERLRGEN